MAELNKCDDSGLFYGATRQHPLLCETCPVASLAHPVLYTELSLKIGNTCFPWRRRDGTYTRSSSRPFHEALRVCLNFISIALERLERLERNIS